MSYSSKRKIVEYLSKMSDVDQVTAEAVYSSFFQYILQSLKKNEPVYLPEFGSFTVIKRSARACTLPNGTVIKVKSKKAPKFTPYKKLKDAVN